MLVIKRSKTYDSTYSYILMSIVKFTLLFFAVNIDRCGGTCTTLNDLSNKVCVPIKTEDLNLGVFNKITGINQSNIKKAYIM